MAFLSLDFLGTFAVSLGGAPVTEFAYNKVRALLVYLALESDQPHARSHLAALLWPDVPERIARQNLSQALSMLRAQLGERAELGARPPFLLVSSESIAFNLAASHSSDVARFTALLSETNIHRHHAAHSCTACVGRLRDAAALYRGDLLPDLCLSDSELFEEWLQGWRDRLRTQALGALDRLTEAAEWRGALPEALGYARRLTALESQGAVGTRAQARLLALEAAVLRRVPHTPQQPQAWRCRSQELDDVCALLRSGARRIVTVTGPAGSGKTHLAQAAAQGLRFDYADGVCLVDLANVGPHTALRAVAEALGVESGAERTLLSDLTAYLRERHLLLVLESCERALETAPEIAALVAACPGLAVLATSRVPLRIRAEQQFPLVPHQAAPQRLR